MNKRHALLLTAVLGMAAAQAQTAPTTTTINTVQTVYRDPSLTSAPITANVGKYVGPLSTLLASIAKAAGYEVVFNFNVDALALINGEIVHGSGTAAATTTYATPLGRQQELPAKPVVHNFTDAPFNEAWPLLMDVYELEYQIVSVGNKKFLRISQRPQQLAVKLNFTPASTALDKAKEFFGEPQYEEELDADKKPTGRKRFLGYRLPDDMKIVADEINNRLIVGGGNDNLEKVRAFIDTIDVAPPKTPPVTVSIKKTTYRVQGEMSNVTKFFAEQFPAIKVSVYGDDVLLLEGPSDQIDSAVSFLSSIDRPRAVIATGPQTVQRVFQLVNASAEEVRDTLMGTEAFQATETKSVTTADYRTVNSTTIPVPAQPGVVNADPTNAAATSTNTETSDNSGKSSTFRVVADKRTNILIVFGTAREVAQVAELIPQLDQVVPQVNVQVRIQEITKEASNSLGLNWRASFGGFNVTVGGSGLQGTFNPTQSFMGFNIFPTLKTLESQNLTRTVYDGNVTMQSGQRSLGQKGSTQNASSDAAASIKSGGRVVLNIPSPAGNIEKEIDYGLNLDFFDPQVAPDGSITLRVRGQVNNLKTAVAAGAALPNNLDFANSEAQSTITFKSGQTVLMSGLLSTNNTDTRSGVPFLSSLPVVGGAFGEQTKRKRETQLLIIVTGTIVK